MTVVHAKVTSKGQITLPKELRETLSLSAGDRVEFSMEDSEHVSMRKKKAPGSSAGCAAPFIGVKQRAATVEEMKAGIARHLQQKHARE
ncbi:MAG: AbrB/MazE/SpoVT family DNA-binding domain-containing protein [Verrucomicrobiota bacterium JB022]|nr:AbrB/MazE/SpoVT family DNA-binding domain-containing protein [Verrucomicrobiota bacterium JB022]